VVCRRSSPSTKRFILPSADHDQLSRSRRFHTAWVNDGL
jgi:hypothetical protein